MKKINMLRNIEKTCAVYKRNKEISSVQNGKRIGIVIVTKEVRKRAIPEPTRKCMYLSDSTLPRVFWLADRDNIVEQAIRHLNGSSLNAIIY